MFSRRWRDFLLKESLSLDSRMLRCGLSGDNDLHDDGDEALLGDWYISPAPKPSPTFPLSPQSASVPLSTPSGGTPSLISTVDELKNAARVLANGHGPLAVDTERASAYRYGDRAFLLQLKRAGSGLFLVDAEACRSDMGLLAPVVNRLTWIIHSARTDLPALLNMGLTPHRLFDTELGGRIAGLKKVNLGDMVDGFVGYRLAKEHGHENWSRRPLPDEWLDYAALDVECLLELSTGVAGLLSELDRFVWWAEECEYIRTSTLADAPSVEPSLRVKGLNNLSTPAQRELAFTLSRERDRRARAVDRSPHRVLSNSDLIAIARKNPRTFQEMMDAAHFRSMRNARSWWSVIRGEQDKTTASSSENASSHYATNDDRGPSRHQGRHSDAEYAGGRRFPNSDRGHKAEELYSLCSESINVVSEQTGIPHEVIITPQIVRLMAWHFSSEPQAHAMGIDMFFARHGVRRWQRRIVSPVCADALGDHNH